MENIGRQPECLPVRREVILIREVMGQMGSEGDVLEWKGEIT